MANGVSSPETTHVSTSADNARKLSMALGMDNNQGDDVNRLVALFLSLTHVKRAALLAVAETLAAA